MKTYYCIFVYFYRIDLKFEHDPLVSCRSLAPRSHIVIILKHVVDLFCHEYTNMPAMFHLVTSDQKYKLQGHLLKIVFEF